MIALSPDRLAGLETLLPDEDCPADARLSVTASDLRDLVALVPIVHEAEVVRESLNTMVRQLDNATPHEDGPFDAGAIERVLGSCAWNDQLTVVKAETARRWLHNNTRLKRELLEIATALDAVHEQSMGPLIAGSLADILDAIAALRESARRTELQSATALARMRAQKADLRQENAELRARVRELEERL